MGRYPKEEAGQEVAFDPVPPPGETYWFVVRFRQVSGAESYDSDSLSRVALRDPGIAAAPGSCPW